MSEADTVGLILVLILIIIFAMVGLYEITFERGKSRKRRGIEAAFTFSLTYECICIRRQTFCLNVDIHLFPFR